MAITKVDTTDPRSIDWHLRLLGINPEKREQVHRLRVNCSSASDEGEDWMIVLMFDDAGGILFRKELRRNE